MTSLEATEFARELGKGKATLHPSEMVAAFRKSILFFLYGKPFLRAAKNFAIL